MILTKDYIRQILNVLSQPSYCEGECASCFYKNYKGAASSCSPIESLKLAEEIIKEVKVLQEGKEIKDYNYQNLKVYLKSGLIFDGRYKEEDYEDIYSSWIEKRIHITFSNGEFLTTEISGIEWKI